MQEIIKIAHRSYFLTYDYKLNQLEKENSLLKLNLELEKIKEQYKLETFEQLKK